ncbi:M24 family metallopeptidase, partial [Clostridioides difficile]|uniref:M24 family metallopeptidase n=1 Tax=Clostridioides difficile TaxID=1496 RepID=UPI001F45C74B
STFAMFATGRAFEIIRNSVCYPKLNVKICATHAGLTVGEDGANLHEDPQVPNYGLPGKGPRLREGMVIAIEPMVNAGRYHVK